MTPKSVYFFVCLVVSLVLDQVTKLAVVDRFHYGERMSVIPGFFDLTHVRNPGGAFSFFANGPPEQRMIFFVGTTLVAVVLLVTFFRRLGGQERLAAVALGTILGGALGNLIDRIAYQEVIDFIDIHLWSGYTWPTFNLADSFIVVGVGILMVEVFLTPDEEEGEEPAAVEDVADAERTPTS